ncbi:MAG: SDR family NAD(P)-dependent oxidoreductase [Cyanobacteria bacterium P01_F01_bin.33]
MSSFATTPHASALVVGANRGIGLEFVRQLLARAEFEHIFATYRRAEVSTALLDESIHQPQRLHCLQLDPTEETAMAASVQSIQSVTSKLHLVVNCVGFLHNETVQPEKSLRQIDVAQLAQYFQINSIAGIVLAKHVFPLLKHEERSVFASLSAKLGSIGDNGLGGWYGYRASKAALNMLMRTAAIEYRRKRSQAIVVTLHPGTTDTRLSKPFQQNVPPEKLFSVERTTRQLLTVIDGLEESDSGHFFSWDGSRLPW